VIAVARTDEATEKVSLRCGGVEVEFLSGTVVQADKRLAHVRAAAAKDLDDVPVEGDVCRGTCSLRAGVRATRVAGVAHRGPRAGVYDLRGILLIVGVRAEHDVVHGLLVAGIVRRVPHQLEVATGGAWDGDSRTAVPVEAVVETPVGVLDSRERIHRRQVDLHVAVVARLYVTACDRREVVHKHRCGEDALGVACAVNGVVIESVRPLFRDDNRAGGEYRWVRAVKRVIDRGHVGVANVDGRQCHVNRAFRPREGRVARGDRRPLVDNALRELVTANLTRVAVTAVHPHGAPCVDEELGAVAK